MAEVDGIAFVGRCAIVCEEEAVDDLSHEMGGRFQKFVGCFSSVEKAMAALRPELVVVVEGARKSRPTPPKARSRKSDSLRSKFLRELSAESAQHHPAPYDIDFDELSAQFSVSVDNTERHAAALKFTEKAGAAAPEDIPQFIEALSDPALGPSAAVALSKTGLSAIPALTLALGHSDAAVRRRAAFARGTRGAVAVEVVPDRTIALEASDDKVRSNAHEALRMIRGSADDSR